MQGHPHGQRGRQRDTYIPPDDRNPRREPSDNRDRSRDHRSGRDYEGPSSRGDERRAEVGRDRGMEQSRSRDRYGGGNNQDEYTANRQARRGRHGGDDFQDGYQAGEQSIAGPSSHANPRPQANPTPSIPPPAQPAKKKKVPASFKQRQRKRSKKEAAAEAKAKAKAGGQEVESGEEESEWEEEEEEPVVVVSAKKVKKTAAKPTPAAAPLDPTERLIELSGKNGALEQQVRYLTEAASAHASAMETLRAQLSQAQSTPSPSNGLVEEVATLKQKLKEESEQAGRDKDVAGKREIQFEAALRDVRREITTLDTDKATAIRLKGELKQALDDSNAKVTRLAGELTCEQGKVKAGNTELEAARASTQLATESRIKAEKEKEIAVKEKEDAIKEKREAINEKQDATKEKQQAEKEKDDAQKEAGRARQAKEDAEKALRLSDAKVRKAVDKAALDAKKVEEAEKKATEARSKNEATFDVLKEKNDLLSEAQEGLEKANKAHAEEIARRDADIEVKKDEWDAVHTTLEMTQKELEDVVSDRAKVQSELEEACQQVSKLQAFESGESALKNKITELESELSNKTEEAATASAENATLRPFQTQITTIKAELAALNIKVTNGETEVSRIQGECDSSNAKVSTLTASLEEMTRERDDLSGVKTELESVRKVRDEIKVERDRLVPFEAELTTAQLQLATSKASHARAIVDLQQAKANTQTLETELKKACTARDNLQSELNATNSSRESTQGRLETSTQAITELKHERSDVLQRLQVVDEHLCVVQKDADRSASDVSVLKEELGQLQQSRHSLETDLRGQTRDNEEQKTRIGELQARINNMTITQEHIIGANSRLQGELEVERDRVRVIYDELIRSEGEAMEENVNHQQSIQLRDGQLEHLRDQIMTLRNDNGLERYLHDQDAASLQEALSDMSLIATETALEATQRLRLLQEEHTRSEGAAHEEIAELHDALWIRDADNNDLSSRLAAIERELDSRNAQHEGELQALDQTITELQEECDNSREVIKGLAPNWSLLRAVHHWLTQYAEWLASPSDEPPSVVHLSQIPSAILLTQSVSTILNGISLLIEAFGDQLEPGKPIEEIITSALALFDQRVADVVDSEIAMDERDRMADARDQKHKATEEEIEQGRHETVASLSELLHDLTARHLELRDAGRELARQLDEREAELAQRDYRVEELEQQVANITSELQTTRITSKSLADERDTRIARAEEELDRQLKLGGKLTTVLERFQRQRDDLERRLVSSDRVDQEALDALLGMRAKLEEDVALRDNELIKTTSLHLADERCIKKLNAMVEELCETVKNRDELVQTLQQARAHSMLEISSLAVKNEGYVRTLSAKAGEMDSMGAAWRDQAEEAIQEKTRADRYSEENNGLRARLNRFQDERDADWAALQDIAVQSGELEMPINSTEEVKALFTALRSTLTAATTRKAQLEEAVAADQAALGRLREENKALETSATVTAGRISRRNQEIVNLKRTITSYAPAVSQWNRTESARVKGEAGEAVVLLTDYLHAVGGFKSQPRKSDATLVPGNGFTRVDFGELTAYDPRRLPSSTLAVARTEAYAPLPKSASLAELNMALLRFGRLINYAMQEKPYDAVNVNKHISDASVLVESVAHGWRSMVERVLRRKEWTNPHVGLGSPSAPIKTKTLATLLGLAEPMLETQREIQLAVQQLRFDSEEAKDAAVSQAARASEELADLIEERRKSVRRKAREAFQAEDEVPSTQETDDIADF